jgi:hypothetical protein
VLLIVEIGLSFGSACFRFPPSRMQRGYADLLARPVVAVSGVDFSQTLFCKTLQEQRELAEYALSTSQYLKGGDDYQLRTVQG